jgi:hypothetical protein
VRARELAARITGGAMQGQLFEPLPQWHVPVAVRTDQVRVERARDFGAVWLGWILWRSLGLDRLCEELLAPGREEVPWVSPEEAADRLTIRELEEAYAHCADRGDAKGQMALFTSGTHFVVYMNAKDPTASQELHSREALAPVFADLNQYDATKSALSFPGGGSNRLPADRDCAIL